MGVMRAGVLLELLSELRELRPQICDFAAEVTYELLECNNPVGGSDRNRSRSVLRVIHDLASEQVRVSRLFLARLTLASSHGWTWLAGNEHLERRLDAVGIVAWHQPRRAASDLAPCLRAAQHQDAQDGQFRARQFSRLRQKVLILRYSRPDSLNGSHQTQ